MTEVAACPCGTGKPYEECCKPYHDGKLPVNALLLMRSRYSAYVLDIPDYIIATTHPASGGYSENKFTWRRSVSEFSKSCVFQKLEILDFKENVAMATVTFTAVISKEEEDATFTEKSYFEKIGQKWFYRGGQLIEGHSPNLVTTEQLRILPLAYFGDPILRKKANPIPEITPDIVKLVEEMIETMDASDGIGLAAPQIHHAIRLFVYRTPIEKEPEGFDLGDVNVIINPKLLQPSKETWKWSEACLSIPGLRAEVERPKEITLEYTTLEGKQVKQRFSGMEARVIMHENDHINGILYIDRLDPKIRSKFAPFLQNLEKRVKDHREL